MKDELLEFWWSPRGRRGIFGFGGGGGGVSLAEVGVARGGLAGDLCCCCWSRILLTSSDVNWMVDVLPPKNFSQPGAPGTEISFEFRAVLSFPI